VSISDSAKSVATSRSSGNRRCTSRIAPAYARSSAARSSGGFWTYRFDSASISARSFSLAYWESSRAFCSAAHALAASALSMGLLMFGP
jgi:hypothetical protein